MCASFHDAYEAARSRYSDDQWLLLDPRDRSEAIYREMRRLDARLVLQSRPQRKPQRVAQELQPAL